jgi:type II secretory pathway component GspD/PulD (secretin)
MIQAKHRIALLTVLAIVGAAVQAQPPGAPRGEQRPAAGSGGQPPASAADPRVLSAAELAERTRRDEISTDIETLLAQVAASIGKEFLVDPRVRARVFGVPAIQNPSYSELLSILRVHGYMAVEVGDRVNILPDAYARSMPTRLLQRDDRSVPDDEWVTRVITVPGGNAADLVPILRPMMPQAAHLAASADGKLIVVDTYANVRRMTEVVRALTE